MADRGFDICDFCCTHKKTNSSSFSLLAASIVFCVALHVEVNSFCVSRPVESAKQTSKACSASRVLPRCWEPFLINWSSSFCLSMISVSLSRSVIAAKMFLGRSCSYELNEERFDEGLKLLCSFFSIHEQKNFYYRFCSLFCYSLLCFFFFFASLLFL